VHSNICDAQMHVWFTYSIKVISYQGAGTFSDIKISKECVIRLAEKNLQDIYCSTSCSCMSTESIYRHQSGCFLCEKSKAVSYGQAVAVSGSYD